MLLCQLQENRHQISPQGLVLPVGSRPTNGNHVFSLRCEALGEESSQPMPSVNTQSAGMGRWLLHPRKRSSVKSVGTWSLFKTVITHTHTDSGANCLQELGRKYKWGSEWRYSKEEWGGDYDELESASQRNSDPQFLKFSVAQTKEICRTSSQSLKGTISFSLGWLYFSENLNSGKSRVKRLTLGYCWWLRSSLCFTSWSNRLAPTSFG